MRSHFVHWIFVGEMGRVNKVLEWICFIICFVDIWEHSKVILWLVDFLVEGQLAGYICIVLFGCHGWCG